MKHKLITTVISFCLFFYLNGGLLAQEANRSAETVTVKLNPVQLKAVEGVYQNPRNADMYIRISPVLDAIMGKLLWNNNEIRLTPESELIFFNKDANEGSPLRLNFKKDSTGTIAQFSMGNNDVWKKVKDYKPVVKVEMAHTSEQLKPFEGLFQAQNGQQRFIQFSERGNQLILKQLGDITETSLTPESELVFFNKDQLLFSLSFIKDKDGNISQALVNKRDTWNRVPPYNPTTEQLKIFEGKYQSKDDGDNYLQLIARGNNLVVKQLWDGKEILLTPKTETYFYNEKESYSLGLQKDKDGNYSQLKVLGIDAFIKVKD
ncbi:MAG: hypothetical protein V4539_13870 [Bacteroidota bacterium]